MQPALLNNQNRECGTELRRSSRTGFCMSTGVISYVNTKLNVLAIGDGRATGGRLWLWDHDTACFRNGKLESISTLKLGDLVSVFAEVSGEQLLLTRVEVATNERPRVEL